MARFTIVTRLWFAGLAAAALVISAGGALLGGLTRPLDWATLALFGLCAAVAPHFPIKTDNESSCRLTNVFLVAGAIILPLPLLPLLVLLALVPDTLLGRAPAGVMPRLLVNVPPTTIAVVAAGFWVTETHGSTGHGGMAVLVFAIAGALVTLVQNLLLGIGMA